MSKLAAQDKFLDLSDYGRPFGRFLANKLKNTRFTPIHVTLLFGVSGLIAISAEVRFIHQPAAPRRPSATTAPIK